MDKIVLATTKEKLAIASIAAWASALFAWISQVKESVDQILLSTSSDFMLTFFSSLLNNTFYNRVKSLLNENTDFTPKEIIYCSILIVSIFWVWVPKYFLHDKVWSSNPELLALFYTVANMFVLYMEEKIYFQKKK